MGCCKNISIDNFPKQSKMLDKRVFVCFHYNTDDMIMGTIVRDDIEEPYKQIILLDDGRFVLSTECQYQIKD